MANNNEIILEVNANDGASDVLDRVSDGLNDLNESSRAADEGTKELEKNLRRLGTDLTEIETRSF